jgi:MFS family permease
MSEQRMGLLIGASMMGMIIEVYDFLVYGYVAAIIGKLLFPPAEDPLTPLLLALLVFGVGFFFRPLGGFIFGYIGDKFGRKTAFIITLLLMGFACLGMGLLPTYAEVGILATILLVLFRILQGVSIGGEAGTAIVFIQEHSPPERRAFYTSFVGSGWAIGPFLAVLTLYINTVILGPEAVEAWGWRVPFFVGAALVVIGIIMRLYVLETPIFRQIKTRGEVVKNPIVISFRKVWKQMLIVFALYGVQAIVYYTASITTWATLWLTVANIPLATAAIAFAIMNLISMVAMWIAGYAMDIYGRRPFIRWGYLFFAISIIPFYSLFFVTKDVFILAVATALPLITSYLTYLSIAISLAEWIPSNVRVAGYNIPYQIGVGILGGLTPFLTALLLAITGSILWAISYVTVAALIASLIGWLLYPETKGIDITKTLKI